MLFSFLLLKPLAVWKGLFLLFSCQTGSQERSKDAKFANIFSQTSIISLLNWITLFFIKKTLVNLPLPFRSCFTLALRLNSWQKNYYLQRWKGWFCIGKVCGAQCSHFTADTFAGCKDSPCSGRNFCQQTSQIPPLPSWRDLSHVFSDLKMEGICCKCRGVPSSTASSSLMLPGQHSAVVVFSVPSYIQILQTTCSRWKIRLTGHIWYAVSQTKEKYCQGGPCTYVANDSWQFVS